MSTDPVMDAVRALRAASTAAERDACRRRLRAAVDADPLHGRRGDR